MEKNLCSIPPKTRKEIAQAYGIGYNTFKRHLKSNNIELTPGLLFAQEQKLIYDHLGYPNETIRKQFEGE
jgi:hypothetical protein